MTLSKIIGILASGGVSSSGVVEPPLVGVINPYSNVFYNKSSWTSLADFETNTGFSLSGSYIDANSTTGNYLRLPGATTMDKFKVEVIATCTGNNSGASFLNIKMDSVNTTNAQSIKAYLVGTPGANYGKIAIWVSYNNTTYYSTSALSPLIGDNIYLSLEKTDISFAVTASVGSNTINLTRFIYLGGGVIFNAAKVTVNTDGNPFQIKGFAYSSSMAKGGKVHFGDSLTYGSNASAAGKRLGNLIGAYICGGSGDKTNEGLLRIKDITERLQPTKVYLMLGTNDVGNNIPTATWQANYQSLVNQIVAAGIEVVKIAPPPNNSSDMSVVKNWIAATYASSYIDCYTPLLGAGTGLNASYNSGDGVHLNDAGFQKMADVIIASGK